MSGVFIDWGTEALETRREFDAEAQRLADAFARLGALLVVCFGSRAKGSARADSDLDILVVMPCDPTWTFARRLAELGAAVDPRLATDLLIYTPEEFARLRLESAFVRQALRDGRELYRAPSGLP